MIPIKYVLQATNDDGLPVELRNGEGTNSLATLEYPHHEIHEGNHFYAYKTASLTNGQVLTLAFIIPESAKQFHVFMEFDVATACTIDVLEDVTSFAGGAAFTILNNRRDFQDRKASGATCLVGHTGSDLVVPTGGTEIYAQSLGAGNRSGGTLGHDAELVLKRNSNYLFRITNGTTTQGVTIILQWYEHDLEGI